MSTTELKRHFDRKKPHKSIVNRWYLKFKLIIRSPAEFCAKFEVVGEDLFEFIRKCELIVARCLQVDVVILAKLAALVLSSNEKYQTNFYILDKNNTSRYYNRIFVQI